MLGALADGDGMELHLTRRDVMRAGLAGAGMASFARFSPAILAADEEHLIPFVDPQPIDPKRPAVKWEALEQWLTPDADFFAVSHYGTAQVAADSWRLKVEGLVDKPLEFSLDD